MGEQRPERRPAASESSDGGRIETKPEETPTPRATETTADETARGTPRDESATLIAHRGFAGLYPENTLAAIRGATAGVPSAAADRVRADAVEIDVVASADGEPVVFHDTTLGRLTEASGAAADRFVWETPTERLRELRVLGTDETIPTLHEAMAAVPSDVAVNVEFKNPGTENVRFAENLSASDRRVQRERWSAFAVEALDVLADHDNDVLVSSFYEGALAAVRDADESVPVANLVWDSVEDGLAIAERYDCEAVHPPRNMLRGTPFFGRPYLDDQRPETFADADLLAEAHDAGRRVNVWTVTSWYHAEQLQAAGVDGLIADYDALQRFGAEGER